MIVSFRDRALEFFYYEGPGKRARRIPSELHRPIARKLDMLDAAEDINDLRVPPANRMAVLTGDLKGCHSIRVNDQWRIVFRWQSNGAHDVRLVDYH